MVYRGIYGAQNDSQPTVSSKGKLICRKVDTSTVFGQDIAALSVADHKVPASALWSYKNML